MIRGSGPCGELQSRFEDGLRFLAAALAFQANPQSDAAAVSSACDAVQCFLKIFEAAAERRLADPEGELIRLRDQCLALLTPRQHASDAATHAIEAAQLARDQAAKLLPRLLQ